MRIQTALDESTNFYFAEIDGEDATAIIIQTEEGELNLYCTVEHAESLVKQLQKYINKHKLKVVK
jgi:hypothetical protein